MRNLGIVLFFLSIMVIGVSFAAFVNQHHAPLNTVTTGAPTCNPKDPYTATAQNHDPSVRNEWCELGNMAKDHAAQNGAVVGGFFILLVAGLCFWLFSKTDILRDTQVDFGDATLPAGRKGWVRTYSLARSQMAWWFLLAFGCYVYIFFITGFFNTITSGVLTLLGIGTGSALGAVMIEQSKSNLDDFQKAITQYRAFEISNSDLANALNDALKSGDPVRIATAKTNANNTSTNISDAFVTRDRLAPLFASDGFLADVVSSDGKGADLHRFQNLVWTALLGAVFVAQVMVAQQFVDFDATVLALLGISQGLYLGFKTSETT